MAEDGARHVEVDDCAMTQPAAPESCKGYRCDTDKSPLRLCPLHAAAPALVAALEGLLQARVLSEAPSTVHDDMWRRMDKARAALALARGKTK